MERGIISKLYKDRGYGIILDKKGNPVFFHTNDILDGDFNSFQLNDVLSFNCILSPKGYHAVSISKQEPVRSFPGINKHMVRSHFTDEENTIIDTLGKIFYITNGGNPIRIGSGSEYRYVLAKPTSIFEEQFNLKREIIILFSPYEFFEPRTLDAFDTIINMLQKLRIERICSVVISKDISIEKRLNDILKNEMEMQIVIPFSYNELSAELSNGVIVDRFRKHFFERDLFAFEGPLEKDLYFFGRRDFVQTLINRHYSGENSGVFGLRRTGKTSILKAVCRSLKNVDSIGLEIDCQTLHHKRWNNAVFKIVNDLYKQARIEIKHCEEDYTTENASTIFNQDMDDCYEQLSHKRILLVFDEIENITFDISPSEHWKSGADYINFWQTLRSYYQKNPQKMTYIIAGTNPKCVETISVLGYDNPMFNQIDINSFIEPFDMQRTKEMINKLGGYMGLDFDDIVCAELTQNLGGHPFLIRHFCSTINKFMNNNKIDKPYRVTKTVYDRVRPIFENEQADIYCEMILEVLHRFYPEEYIVLEKLAMQDFYYVSEKIKNPTLISHLLGYSILEKTNDMYGFKIDILKKYLSKINKYQKLEMSNEEKIAEISERRNAVEVKLRKIVQNQLKFALGEANAKQKMINAMEASKRPKYSGLLYRDLFDPLKCEVYFYQLSLVIQNNWGVFANVFSLNRNIVNSHLTIINSLRRDCHAAPISNDEMQSFRGSMTWLEKEVDNYFK